jgi:hypothetical protein
MSISPMCRQCSQLRPQTFVITWPASRSYLVLRGKEDIQICRLACDLHLHWEGRCHYQGQITKITYEGVSKIFRTESITNIRLPLVLLVEKQNKWLWRQNSLDWLTK